MKEHWQPQLEALNFKLGDLGVSKLFSETGCGEHTGGVDTPAGSGKALGVRSIDKRIDIYHLGLLFLQLMRSRELRFTREEILAGHPREMALELPSPYNFALEKALRRHVAYRTETAMELWRDLNSRETIAAPHHPGEADTDGHIPPQRTQGGPISHDVGSE